MSFEVFSLSRMVPNTLQRFLTKVDQKDDTVQTTKQLLASLNNRFFSQDNMDTTKDERYFLPTIIDPCSNFFKKTLDTDTRFELSKMLLNQRNKSNFEKSYKNKKI